MNKYSVNVNLIKAQKFEEVSIFILDSNSKFASIINLILSTNIHFKFYLHLEAIHVLSALKLNPFLN